MKVEETERVRAIRCKHGLRQARRSGQEGLRYTRTTNATLEKKERQVPERDDGTRHDVGLEKVIKPEVSSQWQHRKKKIWRGSETLCMCAREIARHRHRDRERERHRQSDAQINGK